MKKGFRILIVDDDAAMASTLQDILEVEGYAARVAHDGRTAISLFRKKAFDLAVVDIRLPDISGLELVCKLTDVSVETVYIIITGHGSLESAAEAVNQRSIIAYETKPLDMDRFLSLVQQVVQRRKAEEALHQAEETLRASLEHAPDAIYMTDLKGVFLYGNAKAEELIGYKKEELIGGSFLKLNLLPAGYLAKAGKLLALSVLGKPTGPDDIELVRKDGSRVWVEANTAHITQRGEKVVIGFVRDITGRKKVEEELEASHRQLEHMLQGMIHVIERITETRDAYTAGHQRRAAELSTAIARQMGLPEETCVSLIGMAARVHDIGKTAVPAEILAKPGKLSDFEFALIKIHPQVGYDILKSADMPYPVAEVVLQHHERLDGSGYPQGLSGDDILPEAQILAVADVVEAMSSHRPYRSALGIEAALEEVSNGSGTRYYPDVVEACLAVFRQNGFTFSSSF